MFITLESQLTILKSALKLTISLLIVTKSPRNLMQPKRILLNVEISFYRFKMHTSMTTVKWLKSQPQSNSLMNKQKKTNESHSLLDNELFHIMLQMFCYLFKKTEQNAKSCKTFTIFLKD